MSSPGFPESDISVGQVDTRGVLIGEVRWEVRVVILSFDGVVVPLPLRLDPGSEEAFCRRKGFSLLGMGIPALVDVVERHRAHNIGQDALCVGTSWLGCGLYVQYFICYWVAWAWNVHRWREKQ